MKNYEIGLTEKQVLDSRTKYGSNEISTKKQNSFIKLFIESLGEPMTKILIIALAVKTLFLLSNFDWYETVGIAIAIFVASFISTISEYGSEASFKKLQEEAAKIKCRVYRNAGVKEIKIGEVVKNDIILLQAGDKVPADGIVISDSVHVDESALNGESKEVLKDIHNNKLLRGSIICYGECRMLVTAVGDETLYGQIGLELQEEQRESPLKLRLRQLAKWISKLGYIGAFLVAFSYLIHIVIIKNNFDYVKISEMINNVPIILGYCLHAVTLAVTVIVVAVPEGLPMMITLVLSMNMKRMLKDNILVRKLLGIETSGSINILFTDKTGTLTKGKLQVVNFINGGNIEMTPSELSKREKLLNLLNVSLKYNNASVISENGSYAIGGNATDRALLEYITSYQINNFNVKKEKVIPFDSKNKIAITKISGEYNFYLVKGIPEKIIAASNYYFDETGSRKVLVDKQKIYKKMETMSSKSIRFIAVAISNVPINEDLRLNNLTLVGLLGIRDEIRPGVKETLARVESAGVHVVMMTGDAKNTAVAIAREVGLLNEGDLTLTSDEIANLSDRSLKEMIPRLKVISRALPSDKSRLVRICQELDLVVGMTGDGVNDAPAIKKADVGFAMGSGTEVAKEAADIVILDDNFLSISKAILYGRTIFKNIRKFIILQLTVNMCAVGLSIIGPFIGIDNPITIIQMLWINMIMDTLAALAFAGEPALEEYMREKPKKRDEAIVNQYMKGQILFTGIYSLLLCLLFLKIPFLKNFFSPDGDELYLMTAFFALFIFVGVFNCFNARTHRLNLLANIFKNKGFIVIMALVSFIQIYIIYFGGELFRVVGLNLIGFSWIIVLSFTVIPVDWIRKLYLRYHKEKGGV
jgi:calcium-translocating P-type ATPase